MAKAPPHETHERGAEAGGRGGVGGRERVAGQETSSADEVIGLKIKRWRHLKPIPVNELSGAPGKGGDRRGQGGGRRAGPRDHPAPPAPPDRVRPGPARPAARPAAPFGRSLGEGSGHVPFPSRATRRQVPWAPLGGAGLPAKAARGLPLWFPLLPRPPRRARGPPSGAGSLHRCARTGSGGATHPAFAQILR